MMQGQPHRDRYFSGPRISPNSSQRSGPWAYPPSRPGGVLLTPIDPTYDPLQCPLIQPQSTVANNVKSSSTTASVPGGITNVDPSSQTIAGPAIRSPGERLRRSRIAVSTGASSRPK